MVKEVTSSGFNSRLTQFVENQTLSIRHQWQIGGKGRLMQRAVQVETGSPVPFKGSLFLGTYLLDNEKLINRSHVSQLIQILDLCKTNKTDESRKVEQIINRIIRNTQDSSANLDTLPPEIVAIIGKNLDDRDRLALSLTSKHLRDRIKTTCTLSEGCDAPSAAQNSSGIGALTIPSSFCTASEASRSSESVQFISIRSLNSSF